MGPRHLTDRRTPWPREWATAYVNFASGEKRAWLRLWGCGSFPWCSGPNAAATTRRATATRFRASTSTWGTGPGVVAPFLAKLQQGLDDGRVRYAFRHRATALTFTAGTVTGVCGEVLEPHRWPGRESFPRAGRKVSFPAAAVVVASGGIGGNHDLVRRQWPGGAAPDYMVARSSRGRGRAVPGDAGRHRGLPDQHRPDVALSGRHPQRGPRLAAARHPDPARPVGRCGSTPTAGGFPCPSFRARFAGALRHIVASGHQHSGGAQPTIIGKEFALSGSEQNPDLTGKDLRLLAGRVQPGRCDRYSGSWTGGSISCRPAHPRGWPRRMNRLRGQELIDAAALHRLMAARDLQVASGLGKDGQLNAIRQARRFSTDRLMRVAPPHPMLAPEHGPLMPSGCPS